MTQHIIDRISTTIGKRAALRFELAFQKNSNILYERAIFPQLATEIGDEWSYLPIAPVNNWLGRSPTYTFDVFDGNTQPTSMQFFQNPLKLIIPELVEDDQGFLKSEWISPMNRPALGTHQIFTFEYDDPDPAFFKEQMGWFTSPKHPLDCKMGELYKKLKVFPDFEGITVVWSGSKSFHIHLAFATYLARKAGICANLRDGHTQHWMKVLQPIVTATLPANVLPDDRLKAPDQLRRLPWGTREITSEGHILGFPIGTKVPQVVIWEHWRKLTPSGSSFFDAELFRSVSRKASTRARADDKTDRPALPITSPEMAYCTAQMKLLYPSPPVLGRPIFARFENDKDGLKALFFNTLSDGSPSSICMADRDRIHAVGRGAGTLTEILLPRKLEWMIDDWCAEYQTCIDESQTEAERNFALAALDKNSASRAMKSMLLKVAIGPDKLSLVCAAEGIGKTSGLMSQHCTIDETLSIKCDGTIMYASGEYENAVEKCEAFNAFGYDRYRGIVVKSFTKLYAENCKLRGLEPISITQAAAGKFDSHLAAIRHRHAAVLQDIEDHYRHLWHCVGDRKAVYFTVHDVAHGWARSTKTRLMAAPGYWTDQNDEGHVAQCKAATNVSLLIHDEVAPHNLLDMVRTPHLTYVNALKANCDQRWDGLSLSDKYRRWDRFSDVQSSPVAFEEVLRLAEFDDQWRHVKTADSGEYTMGEKSPYAAKLDRPWSIRERAWPTSSACKVIMLTTETVPLTIARKAAASWQTYDLQTPAIPKHQIITRREKDVRGDQLCAKAEKLTTANPNLVVITNGAASNPNAVPPVTARGSNKLIGKDVEQLVNHYTPGQFEQLEALNAYLRTKNMIELTHVDQINQSAGRNIGFRLKDNVTHTLRINFYLYAMIANNNRLRYRLKIVETKSSKQAART
ncbi:hypothetical protein [Novosphingobium sp.]|uniref:hypothetical protein n=1 Tax=Novosphingobium sp. TaxID=1874826 RepID=UPI0025D9AB86|nr:hypothetical protein [Novosphingobium sp.]